MPAVRAALQARPVTRASVGARSETRHARSPHRERLFDSDHSRSPDAVHTAVVAAAQRPDPAPDRVAVMPEFASTATVRFDVLSAARDALVGVEDQAAWAGSHERKIRDMRDPNGTRACPRCDPSRAQPTPYRRSRSRTARSGEALSCGISGRRQTTPSWFHTP